MKGLTVIIILTAFAFGFMISDDLREGWSLTAPTHGAILDEFEGVNVFAAGDHDERGQYGMEYQCVEYVNRFYAKKLGFKNMTQSGHADSYFWSASKKGLIAFPNSSTTPPQKYDILVLDTSDHDGSPGHVAIVTNVDLVHGKIELVQQNAIADRYLGLLKKAISKESFPIEKNARGEWFMPTQRNRLPIAGWSRIRSSP